MNRNEFFHLLHDAKHVSINTLRNIENLPAPDGMTLREVATLMNEMQKVMNAFQRFNKVVIHYEFPDAEYPAMASGAQQARIAAHKKTFGPDTFPVDSRD